MSYRRITLIIISIALLYSVGQLYDIHRVGHLDRNRTADCAIVLGAAAWHDKPSPVLKERLNHAIQLYKSGKVEKLILTGGYGKGADYAESEVSQKYCIQAGIPEEHIFAETKSINTVENLQEAKLIMAEKGFENALIVSDPWHLKRARRMASDLDLHVYNSATTTTRFKTFGSKTKFLFTEFALYHSYLVTGK